MKHSLSKHKPELPFLKLAPLDDAHAQVQLELEDASLLEVVFMALTSRLVSKGVTPHCLIFHDAVIGSSVPLSTPRPHPRSCCVCALQRPRGG